jgi:glycosyltransferase involved in cell wall biosynthesis
VYQRGLEELAAGPEIELTVITPPSWREGRSLITLERAYTRGYELIVTPIIFNGRYHVHFYPRLAGLLERIRPDVVHVDEEPYNFATYLALRAARRIGARRLFYTWQNIYRRVPPPFSLVERANYAFADAAIAANEDAATVLLRKGFERPVSVVPPGVDPDLYVPRVGDGRTSFSIGFIGRLVREKGVDLLLRACRQLGGEWTLTIVGEGDQDDALREQTVSLGLAGRVTFAKPVPSNQVPLVLRRFDVLVLPSRSLPNWREQFGRVLMEAMACALPVIGSTCGEIPRVIGEAGLTFPEGDEIALGQALATLQGDRDLRESLGRRGRERVLNRYAYAKVAAQTRAIYRSLIVPAI